jgi:cell division protein ZipA
MMEDSTFSLRFILLVVGAFIVVGIYIWGTVRAKGRQRGHMTYDPRLARFEPPVSRPIKADDSSNSAVEVTSRPAKPIEEKTIGAGPDAGPDDVLEDLPIITRTPDGDADYDDPAGERGIGQMELGLSPRSDLDTRPPAPATDAEKEIVTLFVRAKDAQLFSGANIVRALNLLGLRYGDKQIFHHYGAGELRTEEPLFSIANMFEPGHFDLARIDTFATTGLAMILPLPSPLEGPVAFELFLNTAQRLTETLGGELFATPKTRLDATAIDNMRRVAAKFGHGAG